MRNFVNVPVCLFMDFFWGVYVDLDMYVGVNMNKNHAHSKALIT